MGAVVRLQRDEPAGVMLCCYRGGVCHGGNRQDVMLRDIASRKSVQK